MGHICGSVLSPVHFVVVALASKRRPVGSGSRFSVEVQSRSPNLLPPFSYLLEVWLLPLPQPGPCSNVCRWCEWLVDGHASHEWSSVQRGFVFRACSHDTAIGRSRFTVPGTESRPHFLFGSRVQ